MVFSRQKYERCVRLDVVIRIVGVLIECEAWLLTWTQGIMGLSGSDIILSS